MTKRLIASTDPSDQGYEYYDNLKGYFWVEREAEFRPDKVKLLYDRYSGKMTGYVELPNGEVIDRYKLCDYGIYEFPEDDFEDEIYNIKETFNSAPYGYVAVADVGLWDGTRHGFRYIPDMNELLNMISGYDDVAIEDVDGDFVVKMYHHDGVNIAYLYEITPKAWKWYQNNPDIYELNDIEFMEKVANTPGFNKKPDIANRVYGTISANRKSQKRKNSPRAKTKVKPKATKPKAAVKKAVAKKPIAKKKPATKKPTVKKTSKPKRGGRS